MIIKSLEVKNKSKKEKRKLNLKRKKKKRRLIRNKMKKIICN
jgi:hypothetical protein